MQKRVLLSVLLGLSVLWIGGCAQDVGDIDRTQPNKLQKDVFEGEWYMRQTFAGVPGTGQVGFVGYEANLERIRFQVQEDLLVAHRVHEDVLGIDSAKAPMLNDETRALFGADAGIDHENWVGAPVAAFPIQQHFDIQRQYNSSTGEQQNVITENNSDRPWDEREYVRVNWRNKIFSGGNDFFVAIDQYSDAAWYEGGAASNTPIYVECRDADGNFYDCDPEDLTSDDEIAYFQVTNSYVMYPSWIDCVLTFGFPLYGGDCGPETISLTTSFWKLAPEDMDNYEPRKYSDNEMDWFGYFRTERCAYDRLYGCRDQSTIYLANRHNIWDEWYTDANGNARFDDGERLDYAARTPRPIVYYINEAFPADLMDDALEIADQYNEAFRNVVREYQPAFDGRMFYLCANSGSEAELAVITAAETDGTLAAAENAWTRLTEGYEAGACKRQGKAKQIGDIRYSYFYWVDNPQQQGPLGYGPSSTDPITGQTVSANAYIYGAAVDTYAQYTVDLIDLINGDLTPEEYGMGENVDGYFQDAFEKLGVPTIGFSEPPGSGFTAADMARFQGFEERLDASLERLDNPRFVEKFADPSQLVRHQDVHRSTWAKMKGTEIESRLLTPEIKTGLGAGVFGPDDAVTDEMVDALSLRKTGIMPGNGFRRPDMASNSGDYWERFDKFASRNMYMAEFLDDALLGIAIEMRNKHGNITDTTERRLRIWYDLRSFIFKHVEEHEVGHTVGLRHNFEASYDAMSFDPEYWKIRYEGDALLAGQNLQCPGVPGVMLGDHHCVTRGLITQDLEKRIREYAYSSTMDYGAKPNSTSKGIGLYDHAALAYGYGELVHVFKPGSEPSKFKMTVTSRGDIDPSGGLGTSTDKVTDWNDIEEYVEAGDTRDQIDAHLDFWHYTVLPLMFANSDANIDQMYEREFVKLGEYNVENPSRLRVPYRFCSDEFRGATPYCQVWDDGADYTEIIENYTAAYDSYYFTNSYRRGRAGWGLWLWPHISRLYGRYFSPVASMYQHWLIRASSWDNWYGNPYAGGLQLVGVEDGLRSLLSVLSTPHPGAYLRQGDTFMNIDSDPSYAEGAAGDWLRLEPGMKSKWRFSRYDYDSGYYYFLRYEILSSFWDRWAALMALTNPEYNDIGVDASSDITAYLIPYYLLYSYELSTVFGGIMTEDIGAFAPVVNLSKVDGTTVPREALEYRDPLAGTFKRLAYKDPTQYLSVNPYPGAYGNSSINDRFFSTVYSLAFFQVLYDQSFNHASEIFVFDKGGTGAGFADSDNDGVLDIVEGHGDGNGNGIPAYLDSTEQVRGEVPDLVTYEDPFNHKIYGAVRYTQADAPLFSPGMKMLEKANRLAADFAASRNDVSGYDVQSIREDIEWMMLCNETFAAINAWSFD